MARPMNATWRRRRDIRKKRKWGFGDIFTRVTISFYVSKRSRAVELKAEKARIELARALLAQEAKGLESVAEQK